MNKQALALFDFDGTITNKDSFVSFLLFNLGKFKFILGFMIISPFVFLYLIKLLPNWKMKELVLRFFYRGFDAENFKSLCQDYGRKKLPGIIRPDAQKKIDWHLKKGHQVAVVTATIEYYLKEWCDKQNISLITTKMEIENNKITGKILGKICYGEEKARRIKEKYDLSHFDRIYAYGDSGGDLAMLDLAEEKYFRWKKIS